MGGTQRFDYFWGIAFITRDSILVVCLCLIATSIILYSIDLMLDLVASTLSKLSGWQVTQISLASVI